MLRTLEQLRRGLVGLSQALQAPKMCHRSSCPMDSRFKKAPVCCVVLGEAFLGHRIPPGYYIQPTEPCPCSAVLQGKMSFSHLCSGC